MITQKEYKEKYGWNDKEMLFIIEHNLSTNTCMYTEQQLINLRDKANAKFREKVNQEKKRIGELLGYE